MKKQTPTKAVPTADREDGRNTRHEERRRQLMDDAVAYVLKVGFADLAIRPMADALGISHVTLLHHFGSKEDLVMRVLAEVRARELARLELRAAEQQQDPLVALDTTWAYMTAPERLPLFRAYVEIYALIAKDPARHAEFVDSLFRAWLPVLVRYIVATGVPRARAEALATLVNASCRGLIIDLLITGETARVNRAFRLLRSFFAQELEAGPAGTQRP